MKLGDPPIRSDLPFARSGNGASEDASSETLSGVKDTFQVMARDIEVEFNGNQAQSVNGRGGFAENIVADQNVSEINPEIKA